MSMTPPAGGTAGRQFVDTPLHAQVVTLDRGRIASDQRIGRFEIETVVIRPDQAYFYPGLARNAIIDNIISTDGRLAICIKPRHHTSKFHARLLRSYGRPCVPHGWQS
jgi:hypothetical protein